MPSATRLTIGGQSMSHVLTDILSNQYGLSVSSFYLREVVRDIKEDVAYVALDYEQEMAKYSSASHLQDISPTDPHAGPIVITFPDHGPISLGVERFRCMEAYFQPHLFDLPASESLPEAILNCIAKCPIDFRKELLKHIVLLGGGSKVPGIAQRLKKELAASAPPSSVSILLYPQRHLATWLGGAYLSKLPSFQQSWTSKEEYDESGPSIVGRRMCV